jgi:hypothetical protein
LLGRHLGEIAALILLRGLLGLLGRKDWRLWYA